MVSLFNSIVSVRYLPQNDDKDSSVHEDDYEVKLKECHRRHGVFNIPSRSRVNCAQELEIHEQILPAIAVLLINHRVPIGAHEAYQEDDKLE